ncbi:MAG TPA: hypothetical protein VI365_35165, partial [Trebonia sp.]
MTYMGTEYHPAWLDKLADDVTLEGAAMNGVVQGAEAVHTIVRYARTLYDNQEFSFVGPFGDNSLLEEFTAEVRGEPIRVIVVVTSNAAGKTQRIVVNHRPRSSLLHFSHEMGEKFGGEHFLVTG